MAPRRRTVLAAVSTATATAAAGCTNLLGTGADDETDGSTSADEVATAFVDDLANGRFEQASERFVENGRDRYGDPGRLERVWLAFETVGGAFEEVVETSVTASNRGKVVTVTLAFDRGDHDCGVIVDTESRIRNCGIADEYERPAYVDSNAFGERDVSLSVPDCSLSGTVATPTDGDGVPGVVLVHDDGPMTADTPRGATRTFADLAEGLATRALRLSDTTNAILPARSRSTSTRSIASPSTTPRSRSSGSGPSTASTRIGSSSSGTDSAAEPRQGSPLETVISPASSGWPRRRGRIAN